ncbi:MAG: nitrophenyl compound nitroreductase subunit ArsF family protein [Ignavibacteria bacterium]
MYTKLVIIIFLAFSVLFSACSKEGSIEQQKKSINGKYIVYYFHPTARCESCINLEAYIKEVIETKYSNAGFVFKSINIEDRENEHFRKDYNLKFSSVVLVNIENNKWKNLDSIWSYVEAKEGFFNYAEKEINNFIKTDN